MSDYKTTLLSFETAVLLPLAELKTDPVVNIGDNIVSGSHSVECVDTNAPLIHTDNPDNYCMDYTALNANTEVILSVDAPGRTLSLVWEDDGIPGDLVAFEDINDSGNNFKFQFTHYEITDPVIKVTIGANLFNYDIQLTETTNKVYILFAVFHYNDIVEEFKIYQLIDGVVNEKVYVTVPGGFLPNVNKITVNDVAAGALTNAAGDLLTNAVGDILYNGPVT